MCDVWDPVYMSGLYDHFIYIYIYVFYVMFVGLTVTSDVCMTRYVLSICAQMVKVHICCDLYMVVWIIYALYVHVCVLYVMCTYYMCSYMVCSSPGGIHTWSIHQVWKHAWAWAWLWNLDRDVMDRDW